MARIYLGNGQWAEIREPSRSEYPSNLGGAVSYSLTLFLYKFADIVGGVLGSVLGGALVQFFERIEPGLVTYVRPLIDWMLRQPNMPDEMRQFLSQLRNPTNESAVAVLSSFGGMAGSTVVGSVLNSLMAPVTFGINHSTRPARSSPAELFAMKWRGRLPENVLLDHLRDVGYPDIVFSGYEEINRPRLDPSMMLELLRRGQATPDNITSELRMRGFRDIDAQAFVDLRYRYLDTGTILQAYLRGLKTRESAESDLRALGYNPTDISTLFQTASIIPGASDLIHMSVREAFSEDVVHRFGYDQDFPSDIVPWAEKIGLSSDWVRRYWRAHWDLPSPTMGYEMLHRGVIDKSTLDLLLRVADYPAFWRDKMIAIGYNPLTRVDVRRMYGLGVLDRAGVKRAYQDLGYNETNAELLTQFTIKYEEGDESDRITKHKHATETVLVKAYKKGILSSADLTTRLIELGYDTDDTDMIIALADAEALIDRVPDYVAEYRRDMKTILENAYVKGVMSRSEVSAKLQQIGLEADEITFTLAVDDLHKHEKDLADRVAIVQTQYVNRSIDRSKAVDALGRLGLPGSQNAALFAEWDVARSLRTKRLTLAEYGKALEFGFINEATFRENMAGLGYTPVDIDLYVTMKLSEENIV